MKTETTRAIRVLIADDDEHVLNCYRDAFAPVAATQEMLALDQLAAELFADEPAAANQPVFDCVTCSQGDEAVRRAAEAQEQGQPFDVVILDVRMPPGLSGVEAGARIREIDASVDIVIVSGFADVPDDELAERLPPPAHLHVFSKPLLFSRLVDRVAELAAGR